MYSYNNQSYGYTGNQGYPQQQAQQPQQVQQQPSYNQWSTQQQQPQLNQLQSQPTGFGFGSQVASQPTGIMKPQQFEQTQPGFTQQTSGWNQQAPPMTSFQSQPTGGLMPQRTGYQSQPAQTPLQSQATGWNQLVPPMTSFQAQATGYQQGPPTTSFQSQPTGGFMPQQTGYQFQQPLQSQNTGWTQQPQTSFGVAPLQSQSTGWNQGLQPQRTGVQQPLTAQPTGFISNLANIGNQKNDLELPNIRLSFITARDQDRFETIFRNNVPKGENAMDGNTAKSILMKSGLSAVKLSQIWELADTNKSGSLMFPEFCVALHLANMAKRGQSVPFELPIKIKNEVTGFVDAINFNIGTKSDYSQNNPIANQQTGFQNQIPLTAQRTGVVLNAQQTGMVPINAQPTGLFSQKTGGLFSQKTGGLLAQATGSAPPMTSFMAQPTGGFMPQQTGFQSQPTGGFIPQQTGLQSQQFTGFQSQATGGLYPQQTGLQPMLTGRPGQWGFVSAPTGGLPGLDMMQSHFMPNAATQTNMLQSQMGGQSARNVTWAITKQEKMIYDNIFKQWDKDRKGFIEGNVSIEIFSKSGLSFSDLEKIWTLSDQGNKGKLNRDEFAVAMHLIYRRLNGFDIPLTLPPELVPPSSKILENTVDSLKDQLKKQASKGGVHSTLNVKSGISRSGTSFKNDDDSINYVSNSRHRKKSVDESPAKSQAFSSKLSIEDLKKQIHEKRILLDAIDAEDADTNANIIQQKTLNEIEILKSKIKSAQSKLNSSNFGAIDSVEQKQELSTKLNKFADKIPQLMDAIYQVDEKLKSAKVELFRLKLQKENPSGIEFKGTGPNGEVTETDKRIAKQKALLQAKMAKLTGKPAPNFDAFEDNEARLNQEVLSVTKEFEEQKSMIQEISSSIKTLIAEVSDSLNLTNAMSVGHSKWEKKEGVQNKEVSDFIDYLNSTKPAHKTAIPTPSSLENPYLAHPNSNLASKEPVESNLNAVAEQQSAKVSNIGHSTPPSSSSGLSASEERARRIKEKAEKRMNERLAKLGITRKPASNTHSEQEKNIPTSKVASTSISQEEKNISTTKEIPASISRETQKPFVQPTKQAPAPPPTRAAPAQIPAQIAAVSKPSAASDDSDEDSDEDEEYKALLEQKKAMEQREKERKERKAREKQERLAKLKAEMEELRKQQEGDSDDSWCDDNQATATPVSNAKQAEEAPVPTTGLTTAHSNNPFAAVVSEKQESKPVVPQPTETPEKKDVKPSNSNPFSKLQANGSSSNTVIDAEKLKAQRASQMGRGGDDDDWSDSGDEDSDDEMPSANKQAELASMLFGGSTSASRSNTFIPPVSTVEEKNIGEISQSKSEETNKDTVAPEVDTQPFPPSTPVTHPPAVPELQQSGTTEKSLTPPPLPETAAPVPSVPATVPPGLPLEQVTSSNGEFYDAKSEESSFIDPTPPSSPEVSATTAEVPDEEVPPVPTGVAPAPPIPTGVAPAPPIPTEVAPAPPAPPAPTQVAPPAPPAPAPPAPSLIPSITGGPADINALLGEIHQGARLKKVDDSEKHIADGAVVGRVL